MYRGDNVSSSQQPQTPTRVQPVTPNPEVIAWWKNPYCWLILVGPLTVIVAGLVTVWIAVKGADPVIDANYYQKGLALSRGASPDSAALAPARQARNHAATGGAASPTPAK
jgi:uncharacterized protein